MGLIDNEAEVCLASSNIKYYENLGYEIPRYYNKNNRRYFVKINTRIKVKISDLKPYSNTLVNVKCDSCGKKYSMPYSEYTTKNHNGNVYCKHCASMVLNSGENNWKYKSELTDDERFYNRGNRNLQIGYSKWSKSVLARDKYVCQKCGKAHDRGMVAHHIESYDSNKDRRMDVTNGITLCGTCHRNFHSLYGYGKNTKEQFQEWFDKPLDEILKEYNGEIPTNKPIVCLETRELISNIKEYSENVGIKEYCFWQACNRGSLCNFKHYMYYEDFIKLSDDQIEDIIKTNKNKKNFGRKIVKLDINDGSIIAIYNQLKEAIDYNHITGDTQGISYCANHVYKYSHGYKWEWFDYYCDNIDTETKPSELLSKYLILSKDLNR